MVDVWYSLSAVFGKLRPPCHCRCAHHGMLRWQAGRLVFKLTGEAKANPIAELAPTLDLKGCRPCRCFFAGLDKQSNSSPSDVLCALHSEEVLLKIICLGRCGSCSLRTAQEQRPPLLLVWHTCHACCCHSSRVRCSSSKGVSHATALAAGCERWLLQGGALHCCRLLGLIQTLCGRCLCGS
jgi:hypothetical protein